MRSSEEPNTRMFKTHNPPKGLGVNLAVLLQEILEEVSPPFEGG